LVHRQIEMARSLVARGGVSFRLHGRNANTWDKKGLTASSERFDYEYRETELRQFIPPVVRLAHQAERVHVLFNNNLKDQGIRGARTFSDLLSSAVPVADQSDPLPYGRWFVGFSDIPSALAF
jgi:uncharacterized protein YecE (DUF72 family)